ncbi:MAG: class I SAM-dependent methyltransferase [Steroidobacteraceae bacterium]
MNFQDHFGAVANTYADHRPGYPPALFEWLAAHSPGRTLAWESGAGSGQATVELARHFDRVLATDASAAQLAEAPRLANVEYRAALAQFSGLAAGSVDLAAVGQALHWFDRPAFYAEVRRVLRPQGLLAAWSYGVLRVEGTAVDACVQQFYRSVSPYWPAGRAHVDAGYRDLDFPFPVIRAPSFAMSVSWRFAQLLGYARSWSAVTRCAEATGEDPVSRLERDLEHLWEGRDRPRRIEWPLTVLAGCRPEH